MCTVSMIGDHYADKWRPVPQNPPYQPTVIPTSPIYLPPPITREEFDALKRDVEEMKLLLKRAKQYDADHGEPDCEMDEKLVILRRVAEMVGVDLTDVLG